MSLSLSLSPPPLFLPLPLLIPPSTSFYFVSVRLSPRAPFCTCPRCLGSSLYGNNGSSGSSPVGSLKYLLPSLSSFFFSSFYPLFIFLSLSLSLSPCCASRDGEREREREGEEKRATPLITAPPPARYQYWLGSCSNLSDLIDTPRRKRTFLAWKQSRGDFRSFHESATIARQGNFCPVDGFRPDFRHSLDFNSAIIIVAIQLWSANLDAAIVRPKEK